MRRALHAFVPQGGMYYAYPWLDTPPTGDLIPPRVLRDCLHRRYNTLLAERPGRVRVSASMHGRHRHTKGAFLWV